MEEQNNDIAETLLMNIVNMTDIEIVYAEDQEIVVALISETLKVIRDKQNYATKFAVLDYFKKEIKDFNPDLREFNALDTPAIKI